MSRTTREYGLETHADLRSQQKAGEICGLVASGAHAQQIGVVAAMQPVGEIGRAGNWFPAGPRPDVRPA